MDELLKAGKRTAAAEISGPPFSGTPSIYSRFQLIYRKRKKTHAASTAIECRRRGTAIGRETYKHVVPVFLGGMKADRETDSVIPQRSADRSD